MMDKHSVTIGQTTPKQQYASASSPRTAWWMSACLCLLIPCCLTVSTARSQEKKPTEAAPEKTTKPQILTPAYASPDEAFSTTSLVRQMIRSHDDEATPSEPQLGDRLTQQLWQSRIAAPDPNEDAEAKDALARLIKQIRSVQFEPRAQQPAFSAPVAAAPNADPSSNPVAVPQESTVILPPEPVAMPTSSPETPLPTEVKETLRQAVQDPNQVRNPLEMAELLFLSNHPAEAAVLYQKALDSIDMAAETAHEDRAWILFQIGNCLRETNMTKAKDVYVKLIAEYPNCPWAEPAKAHGRLINWYQQARPHELTTGVEP